MVMNSLGVIASFEPARTMAVRIVLPEQCAEFRFGHVVNALDGVLATRDEEPKYAGSRHRGRQHRSLDCGAFGQLSNASIRFRDIRYSTTACLPYGGAAHPSTPAIRPSKAAQAPP